MVNARQTHPRTETVDEIAGRLGRPLTTVKNTWRRHPAWPKPLPERRGRRVQYDSVDIDTFVRTHIDRQPVELEPRRLYTAREIETLTGVTGAAIRADRSKKRWPAPDDREGRAHRWYGATIIAALADRRGYHKTSD